MASFLALAIGLTAMDAVAGDVSPRLPRVFYGHPGATETKDPTVIKFKGRYFLYYSVSNGPGTPWLTGIATSDNLLDWKNVATMDRVADAEKNGFCAPGARVIDGRVHLFYQSYGNGPKDAILHAVSDDGIHFEREKEGAIFRPTGDWNSGRAIDAEVHPVGDKLMLYFATRDPTSKVQMVGIASAPLAGGDFGPGKWKQVSADLSLAFRPTVPTKLDSPGLDLAWEGECIEAPTLLTHGGKHYLFYAGGYNNWPQQIGVAVSDDGVNFKRMNGGKPILARGDPGTWNESESGHPGVFQDDNGRDYLFFQGDNVKAGVHWHLSMVPIKWTRDPAGGPDVPSVDFEDAILK